MKSFNTFQMGGGGYWVAIISTPELQPNACLGSEGADPVHRVQKDRRGALAVRGHYKGKKTEVWGGGMLWHYEDATSV